MEPEQTSSLKTSQLLWAKALKSIDPEGYDMIWYNSWLEHYKNGHTAILITNYMAQYEFVTVKNKCRLRCDIIIFNMHWLSLGLW